METPSCAGGGFQTGKVFLDRSGEQSLDGILEQEMASNRVANTSFLELAGDSLIDNIYNL